jgi:C-terminal peptidase prc
MTNDPSLPTRTDNEFPPPPESADQAPLPRVMAGYELVEEIGRGGMGVVFRARQIALKRDVAVKMILAGSASGEQERRRFLAEAEAVASLQHPGIVQVFDFGTSGGLPYLVMEFCPGGTLAKQLAGKPQPAADAALLVAALADAVSAAHGKGIVHRDLKPGNVLLTADGSPKIADFGLARRAEGSGMTVTGAVMGTPAYAAPEQARGLKTIGTAVDVYALGVILFECLTGQVPFHGETAYDTLLRVIADPPPAPSSLNPDVPAELQAVCLKCLEKDPAHRYASARALADELRRFLATQSARPQPIADESMLSPPTIAPLSAPVFQTPRPPSRKKRWPVWLAAALVLAGVVAGGAALSPLWRKKTDPSAQKPTVDQAARRREALGMGHPCIVLVGVNNYADEQIKSRGRAEADARAFYDLFTDTQYLGTEKDRVRLLLGGDATRDNVLQALRWAAETAREDDPVIVAFFVQGAMHGGEGCLLGGDASLANVARCGIFGKDLAEALKPMRSRCFAAFLDVNFRAAKTSDGAVPNYSSPGSLYRGLSGDDGSESRDALPGRILLLASDGRSSSVETPSNGVFAHAVVEGLRGAADGYAQGEVRGKPEAERFKPDGVVTPNELLRYLYDRFTALTDEHASNDAELGGTYYWMINKAEFALTFQPAESEKSEKRLRRFDDLLADSAELKEVADEGRKLLRRMPLWKSQQELRGLYVRLTEAALDAPGLLQKRKAVLDAQQLPRADAETFADRILAGIAKAEEEHFLRFDSGVLLANAVRALYAYADRPVPDKVRVRFDSISRSSEAERKGLLADARQELGKREDLDDHKDVDAALNGTLRRMDPHSRYVGPSQVAGHRKDLKGFVGVGFTFNKDRGTGFLRCVTPTYGSPAYKGGLLAGDLITHVVRTVDSEGKPLGHTEATSTRGMTREQAAELIQGKEGTEVGLTIQREGQIQPVELTLKRATILEETVRGHHRKDDDSWDFLIDPTAKIAYVRVTMFARDTAKELEAILDGLKKAQIRGLVLDLRGNTGGYLSSSIKTADLFIDDQLIVVRRDRSGGPRELRGKKEGSHLDFAMACLIDGTTASGAEIVAACLQDHKRAVLFGEKTYGKGCTQTQFDFDGGLMEVSVELMYRPSGACLHRYNRVDSGKETKVWGVTPDREMRLTPLQREALRAWQDRMADVVPAARRAVHKKDFDDVQLDAALAHLRK